METITVMSYNICYYCFDQGNHGFPANLLAEKSGNLKEMLMEYSPDLIGLQEDAEYCDKKKTLKSVDYLFKPIWGYNPGSAYTTIRSKLQTVKNSYKLVYLSTGRCYRRTLVYTEGRKKLLFISAHPMYGTANAVQRETEYAELFQHIRTSQWDYCVVTGDFNSCTDQDKANLKQLCGSNHFGMAIGDYMPWVATCLGHDGKGKQSLDNILFSSNIRVNKLAVLRDWYSRLYSDHVPVVAELRLM